MKLTKDYFGPGADGVELDGNQESDRPSTIHWKLTDITPGKYYLGLWQETQGKQWNWAPTDPRVSRVLAGEVVDLRRISTVIPCGSRAPRNPCRSSRGLWLAELQTPGRSN